MQVRLQALPQRIGFHPSRVGAESQAERHEQKTDHAAGVGAMETARADVQQRSSTQATTSVISAAVVPWPTR